MQIHMRHTLNRFRTFSSMEHIAGIYTYYIIELDIYFLTYINEIFDFKYVILKQVTKLTETTTRRASFLA